MRLDYSKLLNDKQFEAVSTIQGPVLILAGAGSGKTRVITYRISYLLDKGIPQSNILAMTFTNKAAREMAARIRELVGHRLPKLTISTFHAFGVSVLREHIECLGYRPNFSIYDSTDKQSLIKEVAREMGYAKDAVDPYALDSIFSGIKMGHAKWTNITGQYRGIYDEYQNHLKLYNAVDFDDLITLPILILKEFSEVREAYHQRYRYFMVDEFQDTSAKQFEFIKILAEHTGNLCVVGDDDQSIYSWRGANYENILNFEKLFPGFREVMLEQNYRSTGKILYAANAVIAHNTNRKDKKLWSGQEKGDQIQVHIVDNERVEADFIAVSIKNIKMRHKLTYSHFGVLVRTNSLTRNLEEGLMSENIPYKVTGGTSFYQRKEVKDIVSYLRIMANPDDDVNLLRIINVPRRGIGKKTIEAINQVAEEHGFSLYSAISAIRSAEDAPVPDKIKEILDDFITLVEYYAHKIKTGKNMAQSVKTFIERINYWEYLILENKKKQVAGWKFQNVEGVVNSIAEYENDPDVIKPSIYTWLNRTIISQDDNEDDEDGEKKVNLMTVHSAKGLEYDTVFLAGVEEGIFPHMRSVEESAENIEEERRLFYVAITRARKRLFMTSCRRRRKQGKFVEASLSPFVDEIPEDVLEFHEEEAEEERLDQEETSAMFAKMKFGKFGKFGK